MSLKFNPQTHEYHLDEMKIPGVSEIIKVMGIVSYDNIPVEILENKRYQGERVHQATHLIDLNAFNGCDLEDDIASYVQAYIDFKKEYNPEILSLEEPIYYSKGSVCYAGTRDRKYKIGSETWCLDIKTSTPKRWHRLQTAAYWNCDITDKRGCLYLNKDGTYKLTEHEEKEDLAIWGGLVRAFWWIKPRYGWSNGNNKNSRTDKLQDQSA
ncbi:MAG: hypothetical protein ACE5H1_01980 [Thermodesulfobacteriota bacterium]